MCGRYSNAKALKKLAGKARVVGPIGTLPLRYNIAPTQAAPIIFREGREVVMKTMCWGFSSGGAAPLLINARAETIEAKPAFRAPIQERRCLVPADGFYEWQEREGKRQPFRILLESEEPFCFAGIWQPKVEAKDPAGEGAERGSFVIITTAANTTMSPLHVRMPLFVDPEQYANWLETDSYKNVLAQPFAAPLKIYPVSDLVNSPRHDEPRCFEPVPIERDLFEQPWWRER